VPAPPSVVADIAPPLSNVPTVPVVAGGAIVPVPDVEILIQTQSTDIDIPALYLQAKEEATTLTLLQQIAVINRVLAPLCQYYRIAKICDNPSSQDPEKVRCLICKGLIVCCQLRGCYIFRHLDSHLTPGLSISLLVRQLTQQQPITNWLLNNQH
jgi:hypothetical protein